AGVIHQLSVRNVTVLVRVRAVGIFSQTYSPEYDGRMSADGTRSCVCGFAFAVKLHERAGESHVFSRSVAIVTFEPGDRLLGHIGPAGRAVGLHVQTTAKECQWSWRIASPCDLPADSQASLLSKLAVAVEEPE